MNEHERAFSKKYPGLGSGCLVSGNTGAWCSSELKYSLLSCSVQQAGPFEGSNCIRSRGDGNINHKGLCT